MSEELPESLRIRCLLADGDWHVGTEEQLLERWRSDARFRSQVISGGGKRNHSSTGSALKRTGLGLLLLALMVAYALLGDGEYHRRSSWLNFVSTGPQVLFLGIAVLVGFFAWAFRKGGGPVSSPIVHEAMRSFDLGIDALVIADRRIPLGQISAVVDLGGEVEVHHGDESQTILLRFTTIDEAPQFCDAVRLRQATRAEVISRAAREGSGYRATGGAPTAPLERAFDEDMHWEQVDGIDRVRFAASLATPEP